MRQKKTCKSVAPMTAELSPSEERKHHTISQHDVSEDNDGQVKYGQVSNDQINDGQASNDQVNVGRFDNDQVYDGQVDDGQVTV